MENTKYTVEQLQAFDAIDELKVGEGVEFTNGVYVERESPQRFVVVNSSQPQATLAELWDAVSCCQRVASRERKLPNKDAVEMSEALKERAKVLA